MKGKLLNLKNLIIILGLVVIVITLFLTTSSYAVSDPIDSGDTSVTESSEGDDLSAEVNTDVSLGKLIRTTIGTWYKVVRRVSLWAFVIGYLIVLAKDFVTSKDGTKLKKILLNLLIFLIMLLVIYFLHYLMIGIIEVNNQGVEIAKNLGDRLSGIDGKNDEYDLYETALSKAYEISAVPGFIGIVMYLLLVYYTYKFVFVYAKRFINIIVLILLAPIIFVYSTLKKLISGVNEGTIRKWFKEFIFNVFIQTLHAVFYATFIGFTLKLSDNDENLIGALIALIIFGFIFKVDLFIRKIFNFVGGSTNISSSKTTAMFLDTTDEALSMFGGNVESGVKKFETGVDKFGVKIDDYKARIGKDGFVKTVGGDLKSAGTNIQMRFKEIPNIASEKWNETKEFAGEKFESAKEFAGEKIENVKQMPKKVAKNIKQLPEKVAKEAPKIIKGARTLKNKAFKGIKNGATYAAQKAKQGIEIGKYVLSGEAVKQNLTADEIIEQYHRMRDAKGLEGLRQKVNIAGYSAVNKVKKLKKYSAKKLENLYENANFLVKRKIREIQNEYYYMVTNLKNDYEMLKRVPSIMQKAIIKQQYVRNANALNVDTSNLMALVANINLQDIREVLRTVVEEVGPNSSVMTIVYNEIGPQIFLSSEIGSSRMGLAILAEDRYEEVAANRVERLVTGQKYIKRKLHRVNRKKNIVTPKDIQNLRVNKVYKFSRFSPNTVRRINRKMLRQSVEENRYLLVLSRTRENIQLGELKPSRVPRNLHVEASQNVRFNRNNVVKTVSQIKFSQRNAINNYRRIAINARRVELANNVGNRAMTVRNSIRIGFRQISEMTPGQLGLNRMVQQGDAYRVNDDIVIVKKNRQEAIIKATGIVKQEDNNVVQFVLTNSGKIVQQVVTSEGKIVQPAVDKDGEIIAYEHKIEKVVKAVNTEQVSNKLETTSETQSISETTPEIRAEIKPEVTVNSAINNLEDTIKTTQQEVEEERIVQHIVTLEGKVIEQVINSNNEIEAQEYVVLDENFENATNQIMQVVTSEDLGLPPEATAEERVQKFEDLLQDLGAQPLLEQVLQEAEEDERELVEVTLNKPEEKNTKHLSSDEGIKDLDRRIATLNNSLSNAIDEDYIGDITRTVSEGNYTVDENTGNVEVFYTTENENSFSSETWEIAQELLEAKATSGLVEKAVDEFEENIQNIKNGGLTPEEIEQNQELREAEKRWAKKHGKESEKDIAEKSKKKSKQKKDGENQLVKITFRFFGAVKNPGQAISLSNRYSIKDFYDKVNKLDDANLEKTQERFLREYGSRLEKMQLIPFSFAKSPVEDMDGWDIYIVRNDEVAIQEYEDLLEKYYYDFKEKFKNFADEFDVTSFDDLKNNEELMEKLERKFRIILIRKGEPNVEENARSIVRRIFIDDRFISILKDRVRIKENQEEDTEVENLLEEEKKKAKDKYSIKTTEKAEKDASSNITEKDLEEEKARQSNNLIEQTLAEAAKEQEEEASVNSELNDLLNEIVGMKDKRLYIEVDYNENKNGNKNRNVMQIPY